MGLNETFIAGLAILGVVTVVVVAAGMGHDGMIATAGIGVLGSILGYNRGKHKKDKK